MDSSTEQSGLYEPLLPPFQELSPTRRGPAALVVATTFFIISTITVGIKVYTMYAATRKLAWNDGMMIGGLAFLLGYTICLCLSVDHGLGLKDTDLTSDEIHALSQNYYAMNIMYVLALTCAKAAVILLIIAIKPLRLYRMMAYGLLGATGLWGLASMFTFALQCSPNRWVLGPDEENTCVDQHTMQVTVRIVDIAIDLAIVLLPALMMRSVQTSRHKKFIVILLFAVRLATPIFTAVSISTLSTFYDAPTDERHANAVVLSVWTTVALNTSLITACVPSIKRFLADWAAGISAATISNPFEFEHTAGKSGSQSDPAASTLGSKLAQKLGVGGSKSHISTNRSWADPSQPQNEAKVYSRRVQHNHPSSDTSDSVKGLTDGVIMQTIDYKVEFEDPSREQKYHHNRSYSSAGSSRGSNSRDRPHEVGRSM